MKNDKLDITPRTKVNDLLSAYPELEAFLMALNPKYKKLKNPILRRTVARIATLTQVARIGGYETLDLVNRLRKEVGLVALKKIEEEETSEAEEMPAWITEPAKVEIDGGVLLDQGKNPLAEISKALKSLDKGEIVLLKTDFLPSPLIDTLKEQGHDVYAKEVDQNRYMTYIRK